MAKVTYSFLEVLAGLVGPGGAVPLASGSGADQEGITIDSSAEISTMQVGADGFGQHSLGADRSGHIVVRLLRMSPVNAVLMGMYNFQTASAGNHGQNIITITDKIKGDVVTCEQVAFTKAPTMNFGKEAGTVEWQFAAVRITRALGVGI